MIAADLPIQRPSTARLLIVDPQGRIVDTLRTQLIEAIRPGDVIVANDAATLPASLRAVHERAGAPIEVRLSARRSLDPEDVRLLDVVVFGAGDHRTRTEDRPPPPALRAGDRLRFRDVTAVIEALLDHPRFVRIAFEASPAVVWRLLARDGRPIQYAHMRDSLALWDVWTPIAALPAAFEPPSAGFAIDWQFLAQLRAKGATFVTLTHAAGISSTGDRELDRRLPFDEPYFIPHATARAIAEAQAQRRRVIAIGTTVTRALEHAAGRDGIVRSGPGLANQRLGHATRLRSVDAILSGTHEVGTSHYELLRAFIDDDVLRAVNATLETAGYRTHEFGDSILIEADPRRAYRQPAVREQQAALAIVGARLRNLAPTPCEAY